MFELLKTGIILRGLTPGGAIVEKLGDLGSLLDTLAGVAATLGITISIIMLIYAGVKVAVSSGNPQKKALAYDAVKSTLVAAAIIGGASGLIGLAKILLT